MAVNCRTQTEAKKMKTRQEMQDEMTDIMFQNLRGDKGYTHLVIEDGFKGYANYSDDELLNEYLQYMGIEEAKNVPN
jgi:hypothetical protein